MVVNQEDKEILKKHDTKSISKDQNREFSRGDFDINTHGETWKNRGSLLYLSIHFSLYIRFANIDGFILHRKFFSHFLLVEDFISCTSLKIYRMIKKNLDAAIYHHAGTSSAYAQCFKTASAMKNCTRSVYYWPALTPQSAGKTYHRIFLPLLVCTNPAPLCTLRSWTVFKIKASWLSTILFLACHARPFSV